MTSSVTHFEIYAEEPAKLAEFYRTLLGWQVDKAPGIDYWRINTAPGDAKGIGGGLLFRPIPGPRSWVHYVHVESLDETLERILGSAALWCDRRRPCRRRPGTPSCPTRKGTSSPSGRPTRWRCRCPNPRTSQKQKPESTTWRKSSCVSPTTRCIPRTCSR